MLQFGISFIINTPILMFCFSLISFYLWLFIDIKIFLLCFLNQKIAPSLYYYAHVSSAVSLCFLFLTSSLRACLSYSPSIPISYISCVFSYYILCAFHWGGDWPFTMFQHFRANTIPTLNLSTAFQMVCDIVICVKVHSRYVCP